MSLMTRAEYARHRHLSRARITQFVNKGKLILKDDKIDSVSSDRILDGRPQTKQTKTLKQRSAKELKQTKILKKGSARKLKQRSAGESKQKIVAKDKKINGTEDNNKKKGPKKKGPRNKLNFDDIKGEGLKGEKLTYDDIGGEGPKKQPVTYDEARTTDTVYKAKLRKQEYEVKKGLLISRQEISKSAFEEARRVRDAILNVPNRTASIIAAETDRKKVFDIMTHELQKALEELSGITP